MFQKLTVIGGGATGLTAAGYFSMLGLDVTLYDSEAYASILNSVTQAGGILMRGAIRGFGTPRKVTMNPAEAIPEAEVIFVDVMSDRHEEVARVIAPYLHDGQHILIMPGNLGSFIFRRVFKEMNISADVTVSEKEGNFCPCRLSDQAEVTVGMFRGAGGLISSLPASDTQRAIEAMEGPCHFKAGKNVLEGTLEAGNVIMHIGSTLLSATAIDHQQNEFSLFKYAFTPSTVTLTAKIREERLQVIEACGFTEHLNNMGMIDKLLHPQDHPENHYFRDYMDGPYAVNHRYLNEDCSCGGALAVSMGRRLGFEMPLMTSLLTIAGAINGRDYLKEGRTLENLGFDESMTLEEIFAKIA
ncbi:MAG: NAD/NADP octopine/nopaline dehydrogenase family protein [Lachnospiraceae bacterium]|nr:NAD/NADP octopine/nopaline dehydrogenase family protein [Lachnospiraceae bacterium]